MKNMKRDNKGNGVAVGAFVVLLIMTIGVFSAYAVNVMPTYNKTVHGFMDAARWSDNATEVKGYLIQAKAGMIALAFSSDSNSKMLWFEQTISTSMETQLKQMDAQIAQCVKLEAINTTSSDYALASYTQGMKAVHDYIYDANGWGDDVAEGIYSNNNCWYIILGSILALLAVIAFFLMFD